MYLSLKSFISVYMVCHFKNDVEIGVTVLATETSTSEKVLKEDSDHKEVAY